MKVKFIEAMLQERDVDARVRRPNSLNREFRDAFNVEMDASEALSALSVEARSAIAGTLSSLAVAVVDELIDEFSVESPDRFAFAPAGTPESISRQLDLGLFLPADMVAIIRLDDLQKLIAKADTLDAATAHLHTSACFKRGLLIPVCGIEQGRRTA